MKIYLLPIVAVFLASCATPPLNNVQMVSTPQTDRSIASDRGFRVDLSWVRLKFKLETFIQDPITGEYAKTTHYYGDQDLVRFFKGAKVELTKQKLKSPFSLIDEIYRCQFNECPDPRYTTRELPIDFIINNGEVTLSGSSQMDFNLKEYESIYIKLGKAYNADSSMYCSPLVSFNSSNLEVRDIACRKTVRADLENHFKDASLNFNLENKQDYDYQNTDSIYEVGVHLQTNLTNLVRSIKEECERSEMPDNCMMNQERHPSFKTTLKESMSIKIRDRRSNKTVILKPASALVWISGERIWGNVSQPIYVEFKDASGKNILSLTYNKNVKTGSIYGNFVHLEHHMLKNSYRMIEPEL